MPSLNVNFEKITGAVKPMHSIGQPPFGGGSLCFDFSHMQHIKNANIPYSRLHDVNGPFGGGRFVDIPNLFRNFDADENDPESYDFAFTDELLRVMREYDITPYFRLGVTIENQAHIKAYHINPPKDPAKWARICEHVIRHYNEGWANGFTYGIKYWEIWNEPDNNVAEKNQMWTGSPQQFYELYDVTAKHLKACFSDTIKVGGYGASGLYGIYYHPQKYGVNVPTRERDERYEGDTHRVNFFLGFLDYIKAHNTPLDFFTWHTYANLKKTLVLDAFIYRKFCEYGYEGLEMHLNEWNNAHENRLHGTSEASAANAAMICAMAKHGHVDIMCYYDARLEASSYGGFFAPLTFEPVCTYYAFYAFGELYTLKSHVKCEFEDQVEDLYAIAAADNDRKAIMIVNHSTQSRQINVNTDDGFSVYLLDQDHYLTNADCDPTSFTLEPYQIALIKNY